MERAKKKDGKMKRGVYMYIHCYKKSVIPSGR